MFVCVSASLCVCEAVCLGVSVWLGVCVCLSGWVCVSVYEAVCVCVRLCVCVREAVRGLILLAAVSPSERTRALPCITALVHLHVPHKISTKPLIR